MIPLSGSRIILMLAVPMNRPPSLGCQIGAGKTVYVGGSFALTGAYAEDVGAMLAAYEDYVKYVNETKRLAAWRNEKWAADTTLELLWRDDELKPAKALTIYEELKAKGMLVFRVSGSPQALALKERLKQDGMGAPSQATGPYLKDRGGQRRIAVHLRERHGDRHEISARAFQASGKAEDE